MTPQSARRKLRKALIEIGVTEKLPTLRFYRQVPTKPHEILMYGFSWSDYLPYRWVEVYIKLKDNGL